jgi:hypothetical protein
MHAADRLPQRRQPADRAIRLAKLLFVRIRFTSTHDLGVLRKSAHDGDFITI